MTLVILNVVKDLVCREDDSGLTADFVHYSGDCEGVGKAVVR